MEEVTTENIVYLLPPPHHVWIILHCRLWIWNFCFNFHVTKVVMQNVAMTCKICRQLATSSKNLRGRWKMYSSYYSSAEVEHCEKLFEHWVHSWEGKGMWAVVSGSINYEIHWCSSMYTQCRLSRASSRELNERIAKA